MEFDDIERILALVREHELAEFELERDGLKIRVRKAQAGIPTSMILPAMPAAAPVAHVASHGSAASPPTSAPSAPAAADEVELAVVKSPIVGTFYRSPEPG